MLMLRIEESAAGDVAVVYSQRAGEWTPYTRINRADLTPVDMRELAHYVRRGDCDAIQQLKRRPVLTDRPRAARASE